MRAYSTFLLVAVSIFVAGCQNPNASNPSDDSTNTDVSSLTNVTTTNSIPIPLGYKELFNRTFDYPSTTRPSTISYDFEVPPGSTELTAYMTILADCPAGMRNDPTLIFTDSKTNQTEVAVYSDGSPTTYYCNEVTSSHVEREPVMLVPEAGTWTIDVEGELTGKLDLRIKSLSPQ